MPGLYGTIGALIGEFVISFGIMTTVLIASNSRRFEKWTGIYAGGLIALYISLEAPLSGMSMNPARTLGSALPAGIYTGLWVYFVAPLAGMLAAGELFVRTRGASAIKCAKLAHRGARTCIFRCNYHT